MKKRIFRILAVALTAILLTTFVSSAVAGYIPPVTISETLDMEHWHSSGRGACGPCSGVSIGQYYRDEHQPNYSLLPDPNNDMYDALYEYMGSNTWAYLYGYWFCRMTEDYGYGSSVFNYVRDMNIDDADTSPADGIPDCFAAVINAINHGWPVALNGEFPDDGGLIDPGNGNGNWPTEGHWWAIRGYSYRISFYGGTYHYSNFRIICTDSYSHADDEVLDWNYLVGHKEHMHTVIIKA